MRRKSGLRSGTLRSIATRISGDWRTDIGIVRRCWDILYFYDAKSLPDLGNIAFLDEKFLHGTIEGTGDLNARLVALHFTQRIEDSDGGIRLDRPRGVEGKEGLNFQFVKTWLGADHFSNSHSMTHGSG